MSDAKPAEAAPPKKKKKLFLIIGIVVLILAIAGGAAVFLMKKKAHSAEGEDGEETSESEKPAKSADKHAPPVFVKLDAFTVRLQTDSGDSYLQAVPELRVLDAHVGEDVKVYTPEMRHKALLVIAAKTPADVNNPAGVQKLANELRVAFNEILNPPNGKKKKKQDEGGEISDTAAPDDPIQAVLFDSFIVQ